MSHARPSLCRTALAIALTLLVLAASAQPRAEAAGDDTEIVTGELANGSPYELRMPANWSGVVMVDPDILRSGTPTAEWLVEQGHATVRVSRSVTGWDLRQAMDDLIEALELFAERFAEPHATIVHGVSRGGLVTRGVIEAYPDLFDGAVPMCGGGAGLVGMWNPKLDSAFVFRTLFAPDDDRLELVEISEPARAQAAFTEVVEEARATPEGRARLALAGAVSQVATWPAGDAEPPPDQDAARRVQAIADFLPYVVSPINRAPIEANAGGSISWNVGVDYGKLLARSGMTSFVQDLYREAGLDLRRDLRALEDTPRITPDADAVDWARGNATYTGQIEVPVLALSTGADGAAPLSESRAYDEALRRAGTLPLLRQAVVQASGHCVFTTAERIAALDVLLERVTTGRWAPTNPQQLNRRAQSLAAASGGSIEPRARFMPFGHVPQFPRPFFADSDLP